MPVGSRWYGSLRLEVITQIQELSYRSWIQLHTQSLGPSIWQAPSESWRWTEMNNAQPLLPALQMSLKDSRVTHPGHLASLKPISL